MRFLGTTCSTLKKSSAEIPTTKSEKMQKVVFHAQAERGGAKETHWGQNNYVRIAHTVPREKNRGRTMARIQLQKERHKEGKKKKGKQKNSTPKTLEGRQKNVSVATRKIGHAWPASLLVARMPGCRKKMRPIMTKGSYVVPKPISKGGSEANERPKTHYLSERKWSQRSHAGKVSTQTDGQAGDAATETTTGASVWGWCMNRYK